MFKYYVYEWAQVEGEGVREWGRAGYFTCREWDLCDVKQRVQRSIWERSADCYGTVEILSSREVALQEYLLFLKKASQANVVYGRFHPDLSLLYSNA